MSGHNTPFDIPGREDNSPDQEVWRNQKVESEIHASYSHIRNNWPSDQVKPDFVRVQDYIDFGEDGIELMKTTCEELKFGSELDKLADRLGGAGLMLAVGEWLKNCDHSGGGSVPRVVGQAIIELAKIEW